MNRRQFQSRMSWGLGLSAWASCAGVQKAWGVRAAKVVIIGGGFGGATAAKYLKIFSKQHLQVTLIESEKSFISSPMSNLILGGNAQMKDIEFSYASLKDRYGIELIQDRAIEIDFTKKKIHCHSQKNISYDKLILAPGMQMILSEVDGLQEARQNQQIFQAWDGSHDIMKLQAQIASMQNGQTFVLSVPESPFKCPPGPYERASQVASFFKKHKPQCKVLLLDANQDILSNSASFKRFWSENFASILDYRPQHMVTSVDAQKRVIGFEIQDDLSYDVANILPPMRAGDIAHQSGLTNINNKWCGVDFSNFESQKAKDVHLLGDAIQGAPLMPKSGHMANAQAKVLAAALTAEFLGLPQDPAPFLTNTCYSFLDDQNALHIASVHQYDPLEKTYKVVPQSSGISLKPSTEEGNEAKAWARHIWADMLN
ncbi:MAG: FCSD flavin-binding domain-containing protein [Betaproteobacteria bacterium]|jgi:sulfide dehydrogenase [flavocytochrome c] flavoprotein subunit